jgi:hypothetical protein
MPADRLTWWLRCCKILGLAGFTSLNFLTFESVSSRALYKAEFATPAALDQQSRPLIVSDYFVSTNTIQSRTTD